MPSNVEKLLSALVNDETVDITPITNVEHYLKECIDGVNCGHCPAPISRVDQLLIALRDKLIGGGSAKPEQEKTVEIVANGQTVITPDSGYSLSKVTANVSVRAMETTSENLSSIVDRSIEYIGEGNLDGATSIGAYAFYGLHDLKEIVIPSTVKKICNRSFAYCDSIRFIRIPASVTEIESNSFRYCTALTNVIIEGTNIVIGSGAFNIGSETNKATIKMYATTPPTISADSFNINNIEKIIVPHGSGDAYKAAPNWSSYASIIQEIVADYDVVLENNTWDEIATASEDGVASDIWSVGDEKTITLSTGEQITLVIIGFDHDDLSDGTGKAGITFGMKELCKDLYAIHTNNEVYYDECNLRKITLKDYFSKLPSDLQNHIKYVNKTINKNGEIVILQEQLFLLSIIEILNRSDYNFDKEGTQYEYWKSFKNAAIKENLIKHLSNGYGDAADWWTRSFKAITSVGSVFLYGAATNKSGVSFAFCI